MVFKNESELLIALLYCVETNDVTLKSSVVYAGSCGSGKVYTGHRLDVKFGGLNAMAMIDNETLLLAATDYSSKQILQLNFSTEHVSPLMEIGHVVQGMVYDETQHRLLLSIKWGLAEVLLEERNYRLLTSAQGGRETGALSEMRISTPENVIMMDLSTLVVADYLNHRQVSHCLSMNPATERVAPIRWTFTGWFWWI